MEKKLKGKIALITGASRGIGRAIAEALSAYNMKIGLLGRSKELLKEAAAKVNSAGSEAMVLEADLRDQKALGEAVLGFKEKAGTPDFLINNAGIGARGFWEDIPLERELDVISVNYIAPLILTRLLLPDMLKLDRGHIININTLGGIYASPYQGAYCASKAALRAYSLSLGYELEKTAVRISSIYTGPVDTDFLNAPNLEHVKESDEKVSPGLIAENVLAAIKNPRETVFVVPKWKSLAVLMTVFYPEFFRKIIEKKNRPPTEKKLRYHA